MKIEKLVRDLTYPILAIFTLIGTVIALVAWYPIAAVLSIATYLEWI